MKQRKITVSSEDAANLELVADDEKSIVQSVLMVITNRKGSIPMNRSCGLTMNWLDMPVTVAVPLIVKDVTESIEGTVPGASVERVEPVQHGDGRLEIVVEVSIRE